MGMARQVSPTSRHCAGTCRKLAAWTGSVGLPYTPGCSLVHAQDMTDAAPKIDDYPLPVLPLGRYRLRFREDQREDGASLLAPQTGYLGSAWRGAFGHALRRMVCVTHLPACDDCALLDTCPYPSLFESRPPADAKKLRLYTRTPNPYVLEPSDRRLDSRNGMLALGVTLFGYANHQLPYIVRALDQAGRHGLTKRRIQLQLVDVQVEDSADHWRLIHQPGGVLHSAPLVEPALPPAPETVGVRLISPLRIKREEHYVTPSGFRFRAFAANLLRRISLLTCFYGDTPLETDFSGLLRQAETVVVRQPKLRWQELTRFSSRQNSKLKMGGLVGSFVLEGPAIELLWPYLWLGQWAHIGKACTMGLGRYLLEPAPGSVAGAPWPTPRPL